MLNQVSKFLVIVSLMASANAAPVTTPEEATLIANAAQRGSASAQVLFAGIYRDGRGGYPHDDRLAAYWFEQAAEQGNAYAQQMVGDLYERGEGVEKNLKLAADWREKAANRGNVQAQLQLGKMYLDGVGVARDTVKAAEWLQRAAVEGNAEAQFLYAKMFETGIGIAQNKAAAGNWLAKSAAQGYEDAIRMIHLVENVGYQVEESFYHRVPDLEKLARDGDVEAEYQLGNRYETGAYGQKKDGPSAVVWFKKAAEHGHVLAMRGLVQIYEKGIDGVPPDPEAARYWKNRITDIERDKATRH